MAHPDLKIMVIEVTDLSPDQLNEAMDALDEARRLEVARIRDELDVSVEAADSIFYLRTRSRWSEDKEAMIVAAYRRGVELPDVYSGEL